MLISCNIVITETYVCPHSLLRTPAGCRLLNATISYSVFAFFTSHSRRSRTAVGNHLLSVSALFRSHSRRSWPAVHTIQPSLIRGPHFYFLLAQVAAAAFNHLLVGVSTLYFRLPQVAIAVCNHLLLGGP